MPLSAAPCHAWISGYTCGGPLIMSRTTPCDSGAVWWPRRGHQDGETTNCRERGERILDEFWHRTCGTISCPALCCVRTRKPGVSRSPDPRGLPESAATGALSMATYRLGPASMSGKPPQISARRPLVCEGCAEALGNVDSLPHFKGMSANLVAVMWPEMAKAVERHDAACLLACP